MLNSISYLYESEYYTMGKKKNKKSKNEIEENSSYNVDQQKNIDKDDNNEIVNETKNTFSLKNIFSFLVSIGAIGAIIIFFSDFRTMQSQLDKLKEVPTTLAEVKTKLNDHVEYSEDHMGAFESELNGFKNSVNQPIVYAPSNSMQESLSPSNIDTNANFLSTLDIKDNDVVGVDPTTGKKYKAKKLKDKDILLPYTENGKEIYFYGQYNKHYRWDGHCIINIYVDNKLLMIMDGWYNNGELTSYSRVTHDIKIQKANGKEKKVKVWNISERKHTKNVNTGETYSYFKESNKKKKFTSKNVKSKNIMSVEDFKNWLTTPIEGYYNGNTSGGKYNDETGNAYLVKYFEDGTTRTIYCGNFKNGVFNDHTGKAWYVSIDEGAKKYIYFKGGFTNGTPDETDDHKRVDIDNKDIHKIIDNVKFNSIINLRGDKYRAA